MADPILFVLALAYVLIAAHLALSACMAWRTAPADVSLSGIGVDLAHAVAWGPLLVWAVFRRVVRGEP